MTTQPEADALIRFSDDGQMAADRAGVENWIVMAGQPVDTVHGGGYEFFGPFTEQDAKDYRTQLVNGHEPGTFIALAIQLLNPKGKKND